MAYEPVDLVEEQDQLLAHQVEFLLWPKRWKQYRLRRSLAWSTRPLKAAEKHRIPNGSGIYTLLIQPQLAGHPACSYVMYVGKARNLRARFYNYCTNERRIRPKIVRLLYKWNGFVFFCACRVPRKDLSTVEEALIDSYVPPANSIFSATIRAAQKAF